MSQCLCHGKLPALLVTLVPPTSTEERHAQGSFHSSPYWRRARQSRERGVPARGLVKGPLASESAIDEGEEGGQRNAIGFVQP